MAGEVFTVTLAPYLVAVGDGDRFYVAKHGDVASTSNRYQEVLDYVIDHRMVLERTEEGPVEGMVYPTTRSWYKRSDLA